MVHVQMPLKLQGTILEKGTTRTWINQIFVINFIKHSLFSFLITYWAFIIFVSERKGKISLSPGEWFPTHQGDPPWPVKRCNSPSLFSPLEDNAKTNARVQDRFSCSTDTKAAITYHQNCNYWISIDFVTDSLTKVFLTPGDWLTTVAKLPDLCPVSCLLTCKQLSGRKARKKTKTRLRTPLQ